MNDIILDPKTETLDPEILWNQFYSKTCKVQPIEKLADPDSKKDPDCVRFVCISDTHEKLGNMLSIIPDGDILIHAGDFTNFGDREEIIKFNDQMATLHHKYKIVIAGNHELGFEDGEDKSLRLPKYKDRGTDKGYELLKDCIYLQDKAITLHGIKLYGSSWHPLDGYSFSCKRGRQLAEKWSLIPTDTEILITHTPVLGHLDDFKDKLGRRTKWGCGDLLNAVEQRIKPKVHVYGHVHENHGLSTNSQTIFINASICNHDLQTVNMPIVFDYSLKEKRIKRNDEYK